MAPVWILVINALCILEFCHAFPTGAPLPACSLMTPRHSGNKPQDSSSPFLLITKSSGDSIQVKIEDSKSKKTFRGFLIQAHGEDGKLIDQGTFSSSDIAKAIDCPSGKQNSLTHKHRSDKGIVETVWTPPAGFKGTVFIKATVVENYDTFWIGLKSESIEITSSLTTTAFTEGPVTAASVVQTTQSPVVSSEGPTTGYSGCGVTKGCFGMPSGCVEKKTKCDGFVTYRDADDNTGIHFELVGSLKKWGSGWIAVALSRHTKMTADSVTECVLFEKNLNIYESWNSNKPRRGNKRLDPPPFNVTKISTEVENGILSCQWIRPYDTVVEGITFNVKEENFFIFLAIGRVDNVGDKIQHENKLASADKVNLFQASIPRGNSTLLIKLHGALMTVAWIGFVSLAIFLARHYKEVWSKYKLCGTKVWFAVHRTFMLLSVAFVIGGFVVIFIYVGGWSEVAPNPHPIIGCIATGFIIMQPLIAMGRPAPTSPKRPIFRWIHGIIGNGGQILACINLFFAVQMKASNLKDGFNWVLATFIVFHCSMHLLIHIHTCFMERERDRENRSVKENQFQTGTGYESNNEAPVSSRLPVAQPVTAPVPVGSAFKKFALGLYTMVTVGLTGTLVLMICLS